MDSIDDTAASHQRAFVVEVMGRHCGWVALLVAGRNSFKGSTDSRRMAGLSTGSDFVFIPEDPPGKEWETEMCELISKVGLPVARAFYK